LKGFESTENTLNNFDPFLESRTYKTNGNGNTVEKRAIKPAVHILVTRQA
jgi:hypothetical protein